ncbi:MAG: redoxin domain-containing protein [Novosphingobium sp.]|nr:MAG: redoxin domain-containing protein [Novosphingobium sp.]
MFNKRRSLGFSAIALFAGVATTAICLASPGAPVGIDGTAIADTPPDPIPLLLAGRTWLNGRPTPETLRGKVVLVNFWTYSCINSLRPLPYLRAWQAKYRDRLVVIGVHTPEFGFEKDPAKVRRALTDLGIDYPVVLDSDYALWRQFGNQGWPGFYVIDPQGRVRGYRVGEGDYAAIQRLLDAPPGDIPTVDGQGIEKAPDWVDLASPETYVGFDKAIHFRSPGGLRQRRSFAYSPAPDLPLNHWDLSGRWTVGGEFATPDERSARIRIRFHARDLHLVLGTPQDGRAARFRVLIDGKAPGANHRTDVDPDGWGEVRQDRLYQLVRQTGAIADRTVTIEFEQPGARVYVFTFG